MKWAGHVARRRERRNSLRIWLKNVKEIYSVEDLGVGYVKTYLMEIWRGGAHWIHLGQDRGKWRAFVDTEMNFRLPYNGKYLLTS
jgi:hypothetical protein